MRVPVRFVGRMRRVAGIAVMPEVVAGSMRFSEPDERHVPRDLFEQPPDHLAFPAGACRQLIAKPDRVGPGEDVEVLGRRISAEPPQQLTPDFTGGRSWLGEPGPGSVVEDLDAAKTCERLVQERVHDQTLPSGVVEQLPERRQSAPLGPGAMHLLRAGSDLIRMVEAMMARRGSGEDRRPRG